MRLWVRGCLVVQPGELGVCCSIAPAKAAHLCNAMNWEGHVVQQAKSEASIGARLRERLSRVPCLIQPLHSTSYPIGQQDVLL